MKRASTNTTHTCNLKRKTVTIQNDRTIKPRYYAESDTVDEMSSLLPSREIGIGEELEAARVTSQNRRKYFIDTLQEDEESSWSPRSQVSMPDTSQTRATDTANNNQSGTNETNKTDTTPTQLTLPRKTSIVFTPPDFDVLFENPKDLHFGIADEESSWSPRSQVSMPDTSQTRATDTANNNQSGTNETNKTDTTPTQLTLPRKTSIVFTPPDFDVLFENPKDLHFGIADEESSWSPRSQVSMPDTSQTRATDTANNNQSGTNETNKTDTTPTQLTLPRKTSIVFTPPDFDVLFENPKDLHFGIAGESIDEGVYSFDSGTTSIPIPEELAIELRGTPPKPPLPRVDSVMQLTFPSMLIKNWENSQGLEGFRHRMAKDINHKYCSYCRCDDLIFIFFYVVFGITYICAGLLGLTQCSSEYYVNAFLIVDGVLSVFVFPITLMEWTKRIGGCVKKEEIKGHGFTFVTIVILRITAVILGTLVMATQMDHYQRDNLMCMTVFTLLEVGVIMEWGFLLFVMVLPPVLYFIAFIVAKKLTVK